MIRRLVATVRVLVHVLLDDPRPHLDPVERQILGVTVDEHADRVLAIVDEPHLDRALGYCGPDCALCAGSDVETLIAQVKTEVAAEVQRQAERRARLRALR